MLYQCNWCKRYGFADEDSPSIISSNKLCYHCSRGGLYKYVKEGDKLIKVKDKDLLRLIKRMWE